MNNSIIYHLLPFLGMLCFHRPALNDNASYSKGHEVCCLPACLRVQIIQTAKTNGKEEVCVFMYVAILKAISSLT